MENKIFKKVINFKYISFDIFDTLVLRNVNNPHDVYEIIEKKYNKKNTEKIKDFKKNRIEAEIKAEKESKEDEITLNDIYKELEFYYSKKIVDNLKKLEIETEINICIPNKKMVEIYNKLLENKKNLIITSDMYLDRKTVQSILKNSGIEKYEKLYLSSDLKKTKRKGNIFDYVLKDLKINKKDIIHLGDNIISDFYIPKRKGIKSILIKNKIENKYYNKKVLKKDLYDYKSLAKFISNNSDKKEHNYYFNMGYETFGPILYGFTDWLEKNVEEDSNIFFLARDGYVMQKAFNLISSRKNSYFYASRRALIIPTLWMNSDIKEMTDNFLIKFYMKLSHLFNMLGLKEEDYEKIVKKYGMQINDEIKYEELFDNPTIKKMLEEIIPLIKENSKKEYDLLKKYLVQEKFNGKATIVDIGWNGNMQKALLKIVDDKTTINGYYVGVSPDSRNIGKMNMQGFLFDEKHNHDISLCLKAINSIFEGMFLAPHGSTKKYIEKKGKIEPVLQPYEYDNSEEKIAFQQIQEGALKFILDYYNSDLKEILNINAKLSFYNLEQFAYYPTKEDISHFGDFKFLDEDTIYIAKPKKLMHYIKKPKDLLRDIYSSGWIIAFMKRLTKFNFFYTSMFKFYIKIYMKKKKKKFTL